jgi:hypothetical protein
VFVLNLSKLQDGNKISLTDPQGPSRKEKRKERKEKREYRQGDKRQEKIKVGRMASGKRRGERA